MAKVLALLLLVGGCGLYYSGGDDEVAPDAAVELDAHVDCGPTGLPTCAALYCGLGAVPLDCPRPNDASAPCYCPSATPGWCQP